MSSLFDTHGIVFFFGDKSRVTTLTRPHIPYPATEFWPVSPAVTAALRDDDASDARPVVAGDDFRCVNQSPPGKWLLVEKVAA